MRVILFIILCLFSKNIFGQSKIVFAANEQTQEILVSKYHILSNKIDFIEKIPCSNNELLYNFVVKMSKIAKEIPVNKQEFTTLFIQSKELYKK